MGNIEDTIKSRDKKYTQPKKKLRTVHKMVMDKSPPIVTVVVVGGGGEESDSRPDARERRKSSLGLVLYWSIQNREIWFKEDIRSKSRPPAINVKVNIFPLRPAAKVSIGFSHNGPVFPVEISIEILRLYFNVNNNN